jgi:hypothetical protein
MSSGLDGLVYDVMLQSAPDFIIGGRGAPYLERWFLVPETDQGGVYLHRIIRDDDDRALHDHPWDCTVILLRGAYREIRNDCPDGEVFKAPFIRQMKAETAHRLVVVDGPVVTLVIWGPRRREWGFHCPQGWRPWREFVDSRDTGSVGRGCE